MAEHRAARIALIVATAVVMGVMFLFNASAMNNLLPGVFTSTTELTSDQNTSEITPAGWTFSIWGLIYIWQILFIGYAFSTLCRQSQSGYLYLSPDIMPAAIFFIYMFNNVFNVGWLLLFDRSLQHAALAFLILITATLYSMIYVSCKAVERNYLMLKKQGLMKEVWLIRFLVQNAFGIYGAWCTVATLLNFQIVLTKYGDVSSAVSSTICLSILTVIILIWSCLDFVFFHKYTNYLFAPFAVLPWALGGAVAKNSVDWTANTTFLVVLLAFACVLLLVKVILMFWRHRNVKYSHTLVLNDGDAA